MHITTEEGYIGFGTNPDVKNYNMLMYDDQTFNLLPKDFFVTWADDEPNFGQFEIGKCSGFGIGSKAKYDIPLQRLKVGRFVSGGSNVKFVLNGLHPINTPSSFLFNLIGMQAKDVQLLPDILLENDIWIADDVMILGGVHVSNGCVIGARSLVTQKQKLEPFGIYAGNPARLIRFRFDEKIVEALLELKWWDMPFEWIRANNEFFLTDLTEDIDRSLEVIAKAESSAKAFKKAFRNNRVKKK